MNEHFEPNRFTRNNRTLHALLIDSQVWFSLRDLGRMMGYHLGERQARKLDADQQRVLWLNYHNEIQKTLMVSESGAYALLVYHHIPENRNLRQWLSHDIIPQLRSLAATAPDLGPSLTVLHWAGRSVPLLHWRDEAWVKWRDMPLLIRAEAHTASPAAK